MSNPLPHVFNPTTHIPFHPSYSHICSTPLLPTSKLITIAGQIGRFGDPSSGNTTPSSFLEQVSIALQNVQTCLEAAGAKKTDIVQVKQYVVDIAGHDYKGRVELYVEWMGGHKPPSTLIGVQGLATKELLYEIEVMAVVSG